MKDIASLAKSVTPVRTSPLSSFFEVKQINFFTSSLLIAFFSERKANFILLILPQPKTAAFILANLL